MDSCSLCLYPRPPARPLGDDDMSGTSGLLAPVPQVQRRRRLVLGFDTWQENVRMMRKYRRIFMARIMRMNRQRLERSIDRWVENYRHARGVLRSPSQASE